MGIESRLLQALAKFGPGWSITTIDEQLFDDGYETGGTAQSWRMCILPRYYVYNHFLQLQYFVPKTPR